jgi:hypothetical protein
MNAKRFDFDPMRDDAFPHTQHEGVPGTSTPQTQSTKCYPARENVPRNPNCSHLAEECMASLALERCESKCLFHVVIQDEVYSVVAQVACAVVEHDPVARLKKNRMADGQSQCAQPSTLNPHPVCARISHCALNPQPSTLNPFCARISHCALDPKPSTPFVLASHLVPCVLQNLLDGKI